MFSFGDNVLFSVLAVSDVVITFGVERYPVIFVVFAVRLVVVNIWVLNEFVVKESVVRVPKTAIGAVSVFPVVTFMSVYTFTLSDIISSLFATLKLTALME